MYAWDVVHVINEGFGAVKRMSFMGATRFGANLLYYYLERLSITMHVRTPDTPPCNVPCTNLHYNYIRSIAEPGTVMALRLDTLRSCMRVQ